MEIEKARKVRRIIDWIILFCVSALFAASVVIITRTGLGGLQREYILNIGFDVVTLLFTSTLLFLCILDDREIIDKSNAYFVLMLAIEAIALFADFSCWVLEGRVALSKWNYAANLVLYSCEVILGFLTWKYTKDLLRLRGKKFRIFDKIVCVMAVVSLLLIYTNNLTEIYFIIDDTGCYHRMDYYIVSHVFLLVVLIVSIYAVIRRKLPDQQKIALLSYCLMPVIAAATMVFTYGLSYAYPAAFVSLILCYGSIYMTKTFDLSKRRSELKFASEIQSSMLPSTFTDEVSNGRMDLYGFMHPAKEVGGDFYNYIWLDPTHLAFVIADVSGKGVGAALFMVRAMSTLTDFAEAGMKFNDVVDKANRKLGRNNDSNLFVTAWIGVLDATTGHLSYINAGHCHPVLKSADGGCELIKCRPSLPLAAMETTKYPINEIDLEEGDLVFLYTDGVTEANDTMLNQFGEKRLIDVCTRSKAKTSQAICEDVIKSINLFTTGTEQFDDITMLAIRYNKEE